MADVQTEHGHVRVANGLYRAIRLARLSGVQLRVLLVVVERQYGWAKPAQRPQPFSAGGSCLSRDAGCSRSEANRALRALVAFRILVVSQPPGRSAPGNYLLDKDYDRWRCGFFGDPDVVTWTPGRGALDPLSRVSDRADTLSDAPDTTLSDTPDTPLSDVPDTPYPYDAAGSTPNSALRTKVLEPRRELEEERAGEDANRTPLPDPFGVVTGLAQEIAADCGVLSMSGTPPTLRVVAEWVEANGGRSGDVYREKLAYVFDEAHRTPHKRLSHFLRLWNKDGTPKGKPGTPAASKDKAAKAASDGAASWDAWFRDPGMRGGRTVWALVRSKMKNGADLDDVWAEACERFSAPHAVAWIEQARERAQREGLVA